MNTVAQSLLRDGSTSAWHIIHDIDEVAGHLRLLTRDEKEHAALVSIKMCFDHDGLERQGKQERKDTQQEVMQEQAMQSTCHLVESLRGLVRRTDSVYIHCVQDFTCYFLLPGANLEGGSIVCNRLWDALLWRVHHLAEMMLLRPQSLAIGFAACPHPYKNVYECIHVSHEHRQYFEPPVERRRVISRKHLRSLQMKNAVTNESDQSCYNADEEPLDGERQVAQRAPVLTIAQGELRRHAVEGAREHGKGVQGVQELPALARKLGIPYLSLLPHRQPAQVQQLVALELAQELRCYPLGRERGTLTVAVADPQDRNVLERLRKETGLDIFPVLTPPHELQIALDQLL